MEHIMQETTVISNDQTLERKMPPVREGTPPGMSNISVEHNPYCRGPQVITMPVWLYRQVRKELL